MGKHTLANELIFPLSAGLKKLKADPEKYRKAWANYDNFVLWVEAYINACKKHPEAFVRVWV